MRVFLRVGSILCAAIATALLAACSSGVSPLDSVAQTPDGAGAQSVVRKHVPILYPGRFAKNIHFVGPDRSKSWVSPDATGTLVYICGPYANACDFFKPGSNTEVGRITGLTIPQGVAVDKLQQVYVVSTGASNIDIFAKGGITPIKTLDDPGWYPVDVAVDSNGTVYVANFSDTSNNPGSVSVYTHGNTLPARILTDPNFRFVHSVAVDEHHKLVVCYDTSGGAGACDAFANARGHGVSAVDSLGSAVGGAFDKVENFAVVNRDVQPSINIYDSTFAPCGSIALTGLPIFINFDRPANDIYVADADAGSVKEIDYRGCTGSGTFEFSYDGGYWNASNPPYGVAVDPGPGV